MIREGEHTLIQKGMNTVNAAHDITPFGEHSFIQKAMNTKPKKKKKVK